MAKQSPNWYTDPDDPQGERYWNGSSWTEQRRRAHWAPPVEETAPAEEPSPVSMQETQAWAMPGPAVPVEETVTEPPLMEDEPVDEAPLAEAPVTKPDAPQDDAPFVHLYLDADEPPVREPAPVPVAPPLAVPPPSSDDIFSASNPAAQAAAREQEQAAQQQARARTPARQWTGLDLGWLKSPKGITTAAVVGAGAALALIAALVPMASADQEPGQSAPAPVEATPEPLPVVEEPTVEETWRSNYQDNEQQIFRVLDRKHPAYQHPSDAEQESVSTCQEISDGVGLSRRTKDARLRWSAFGESPSAAAVATVLDLVTTHVCPDVAETHEDQVRAKAAAERRIAAQEEADQAARDAAREIRAERVAAEKRQEARQEAREEAKRAARREAQRREEREAEREEERQQREEEERQQREDDRREREREERENEPQDPVKPGDPDKPTKPVRYKNCDEVRAAGAAPIRTGDPGYGKHLDRDGDGIGCEKQGRGRIGGAGPGSGRDR